MPTYGDLEETKRPLGLTTGNANATIEQFLQDADGYINDRIRIYGGTVPAADPEKRLKSLSERFARELWWKEQNPKHSTSGLEGIKEEIRTYIKALYRQVDDDDAVKGSFGKTTGNVRSGNGV